MLSQDALGTAPLAAPAMILTHQRSFSVEAFAMANACPVGSALAAASAATLARFNVLIHTKKIVRIVFAFDSDQPVVIIAVSFLHAFFAFVAHQKVHVRSAGGIRMDRIVITLRP